jgi:Arm DNA-binding domain
LRKRPHCLDLTIALRITALHGAALKRTDFVAPVLPRRPFVPRKTLTDKLLKSLKPAATDTRDDYWDAIVPGLGVRVTETGRASFVLMTRYPRNPKNPTRRALGEYGAITLDDARQKARKWLEWIKAGRDPADVEEQQRQAELRKQENIFPAVAERFIRYIHQQKLRTAADMERDLRQVFMVRWKSGLSPK